MMYRCLHGQAPRYLADHLIPASEVAYRLRLRSANRHQLNVLTFLAVDSAPTAVGLFRLLARRSGTHDQTNSEIRRVVLIVLGSFLEQSFLAFTSVTSELEVFKRYAAYMCYINPRFTYLLTYLSNQCNGQLHQPSLYSVSYKNTRAVFL